MADKEGLICKVIQVSGLGVCGDLQEFCCVGGKGGGCFRVRDRGVCNGGRTVYGHCGKVIPVLVMLLL